jgi:hypothetical protein
MILFYTSQDILGNEKKYSWWFSTMEFALDVLSALVVSGRIITSAELIDNNNRISLPLDAFDGHCLSAPLKDLEIQWQQLLGEAVQTEYIG